MRDQFDPQPDEPYGFCTACFDEVATRADSHQHLDDNRGHSIRITNPERPERIRSEVGYIVEQSVYAAIEDLWQLTERGPSPEEITEALRGHSDFYDEWVESVEEESR